MGRLNYAQAPALGVPTASPTDVSNQAASTAFVQALVPPGVVFPYAGPIPPTGWLLADGSAISRTTYARLFTAIGTTYGVGDGSTTFNLPDLRGQFIRGLDNGKGVDAGRALGTAQADALQNITGELSNVYVNDGGASKTVGALSQHKQGGPYSDPSGSISGATATGVLTLDASLVARTSTETRPTNVALNFIIKAQ